MVINTTRIHLRKEHYFSFVENALIVAKGCYGWEQDFYSFTNVLKMDREPVFCPEDAEHFHFDVPICVSQQFFGWVCGFGGKVEVTAPAAVRAQLHEMVQSLAEQHE